MLFISTHLRTFIFRFGFTEFVVEEQSKSPRFCKYCGKRFLSTESKFCGKCGKAANSANEDSKPAGNISSHQPSPIQEAQSKTPPAYQPMYQRSLDPNYKTTPEIKVSQPSYGLKDWKLLSITFGVMYISHLLKVFLLYNHFPNYMELLIAIPLYVAFILIYYYIGHSYFNNKGAFMENSTDRFLFTQSLVFTSFFLSNIPLKLHPNFEKSNLNDKVVVSERQKNYIAQKEIPKAAYVNQYLYTRYIFIQVFIVLILGIISLILYVNIQDNFAFKNTMRVFTIFLSGYIVSEAAPIFGRSNKFMSSFRKYSTFFIFAIGFIIFVIGIFSDIFLKLLISLF